MRPFSMSYVRGTDRRQAALLPAAIEDYVAADAPVRVIDAFVESGRRTAKQQWKKMVQDEPAKFVAICAPPDSERRAAKPYGSIAGRLWRQFKRMTRSCWRVENRAGLGLTATASA
jgi:hypothetical protein